MSVLLLIIAFAAVIALGGFIVRKIDSFIARHVVEYPDDNEKEEAKQHDPSDKPDAE